MSLVLVIALVVSLAPSGVRAATPNGFMPIGEVQRALIVEQYSDWPWLPSITDCSDNLHCVVNPTQCAWDVDDNWQKFYSGSLNAGAVLSESSCLLGSQNPVERTVHGITSFYDSVQTRPYANLSSPSNGLSVSVQMSPGITVSAQPTWNADTRRYDYRVCVEAAYRPSDARLESVVGSNGSTQAGSAEGKAVPLAATFTVANHTSKRIRDISGFIGFTGTSTVNCFMSGTSAYPFRW